MWSYIRRNSVSIFRIYAMYEPLRVFMIGALIFGRALVVWTRFFYSPSRAKAQATSSR